MLLILLIAAAACFVIFPLIRCAVLHPALLCIYGIRDLWAYLRRKDWRLMPYGQIICYIADSATSFGCGKTLSATAYIVSLYKRYHGKMVWCSERGMFVTQRVKIISNIDFLSIPYEKLKSLSQFVQFTDSVHDFDMENGTLTITYMLIDEASSQLNSRSFKSNFDPYFIARLLTSRHVRASIVLTSQRSGMVDKLMRDCCNLYIGCKKVWRFQINNYYDSYEIENSQTPALVAPLWRTCWFITDKHFWNYDTFASVQELKKSCEKKDMLSEAEIIALQVTQPVNVDGVSRPSKRLRNQRQHGRKG